jgi:hypothetical protein
MNKIIDVVIILLPRRRFFERTYDFLDRVEKEISSLMESLPHDYKVPVEIVRVDFTQNCYGLPRTVIFTIEEEKKVKE